MTKFKTVLASCLLAGFVMQVSLLSGCASLGYRETTGRYVDDSAITLAVKTKFLADDHIKSLPISVKTFKGNVELSGFVDSRSDRQHVVNVAKSVLGVRKVTNNLKVK